MTATVENGNKWHNETKYFNYYANLVLYSLMLLPFFGFSGMKALLGETILSLYQSLAMIVFALMVIFKVRRVKLDRCVIMYILFQGLVIVETVLHSGFSMGIVVVICTGIFLVILMQNEVEIIVRALAIIAVVSMIINFGYMLILGSGTWTQYFVGGKNSFSVFFIPMIVMVMANALLRKGRIPRSVRLFAVLALATVLWGGSGTGTITAVVMIFMLLWIRKNKPNPAAGLITVVAVHIVLVFFVEVLSETSLWNRIMELMGKDSTLTSRVAIWERVLEMLKDNWLLGVGRGSKIRYVSRWGRRVTTTEAHNFLLELVLESGIVGLCLYARMIWTAVKRMDMDSMLHRVVFLGFVIIMVNGLAEATNNLMLLTIMLALMFTCATKGISEKNYGQ